ncbi:MAG: LysM peptidoglycan-binding domain-containing protein [Victivallaceae bacterium]
MINKLCYVSALTLTFGLLCGCETIQLGNQQQDTKIRSLTASTQENARAFEIHSQKIQRLQEDSAALPGKIDSLQRQINYIYEQNQQQAKEIANMRAELAGERQQRQTQLNQMVQTVAEQTAKAVNSAAAANDNSSNTKADSGPPPGKYYKYQVQAGATLIAIAKAYKVSVDDIKKANRMKDDFIRTGQTLYIPQAD